jgi:uncharacterized protein (TIGR02147 family)
MDSPVKRPNVFDYLDALTYLQDYYRFRKATDRAFSYEFWAAELGLNSRSFLRMLVAGKKKISLRFVDAFTALNCPTKAAENYFRHLVKHGQAASAKERQLISSKMLQILRHQTEAQIIDDKLVSISDPLLPRLLSLLSFTDVRATAELCARLLKVSPEKILAALQQLESIHLVERRTEEGQDVWFSQSEIFHVPDNFGSLDLLKFHEKSLMEALAAFTQPAKLRKYKSLFLAMDDEAMTEFVKLLDEFVSDQLLRFNSKTFGGKRMFQINFNIHPVSENSQAGGF